MEAHSTSDRQATTQLDRDERPWLRHYAAGTPATLTYPETTIPDLLRETARRHPAHPAVVYYGRSIDYRELDVLSSRFANRLIEHGLQPGDRVLVVLPNVPQYVIAHFGILKAGGVVAALSPLLVEREIALLAEDSGARIIVVLDRMWEKVRPIVERGEVDLAIVTGAQDYLPPVKRLLFPLKYRNDLVRVPHEPERGVVQFRRFISGGDAADPQVARQPADIAAFQYTGGTTGLPKAAVLTHRNLVANMLQCRAWVTEAQEAGEVILGIMPFFHAYGVSLSLHLGVYLAATSVLVPRFDLADVMRTVEEHRPTLLPGVPTLYSAIIRAAENNPKRQAALRSIRYCISGGAPLPLQVQEQFEAVTGGRLVEGYGLSEASPVTHANPLDGRARNGTIGLPLPDTEARIVDVETREPVPVGERGELAIRGPQVMQGYWHRPDETAAVLSADGWLYTGDVAVMDEDGFFRIVDRLKDVIITAGENIYPREVEEVLYAHPKVQDAAVVGVPHPSGGQIAKAYIVVKPGETLDRRELLAFCNERLAKFKAPRQFEFRESLPKSATGKVLRRELVAAPEPCSAEAEGGAEPPEEAP